MQLLPSCDQVRFSANPEKPFSPQLNQLLATLKEKYKNYQGKNILLFYSGGMDTSFLTSFFAKEIGATVYTLSFDVGEDPRELDILKKRAKLLGSKKHLHLDVKKKFANEYCARAIQANAMYQNAHPISSSLSRPLMVKEGLQLAQKYNCQSLVHGSSPWQNNAYRFNNAIRALSDTVVPLVPVMDNDIPRDLENEYLRHYGVEIRKEEDQLYSADYNLWAPEAESGNLKYIDQEPAETLFKLTQTPMNAPRNPIYVDIEFEKGLPIRMHGWTEGGERPTKVSSNLAAYGKKQSLLEMITVLNKLAGQYGIGRFDALEHRPAGFKEREVHEAPAATVLIEAHRDLERTVTEQSILNLKANTDRRWTELVCNGQWFNEEKKILEGTIHDVNQFVTGTVRLVFFPGSARVVARSSPYSLDAENIKINKLLPGNPYPTSQFADWLNAESTGSQRVKKESSNLP